MNRNTQLLIETPSSYYNERVYVIDVLLKDFLGLNYQLQAGDRNDIKISSKNGKEIIIPDTFFSMPEENWLKSISLPQSPLNVWNIKDAFTNNPVSHEMVPIIYGKNPSSADFFNIQDNRITLGIDIFGSSFFMLSRYEEIVTPVRDNHDRFPAKESLAFKENFIDRPIVNEYLEILWSCLQILWPELNRKKRTFRILASHDVDNPFELLMTPLGEHLIKNALPLALKGRINTSIRKISLLRQIKNGDVQDRHDTYDWLMDQAEEIGEKCAFFFKANQINAAHDKTYRLDHPALKKRIDNIVNRGHEIGFHPGFHTFDHKEKWFQEFENFKKFLPNVNIRGGRQHFLKLRVPETWRFWEEAGLEYDSTLGFADHSGFRCGVCYEFTLFDIVQGKKLALKERPLIVMEKTLLQSKYMGLDSQESRIFTDKLKNTVKFYNGDFTVLWHNSNLKDAYAKELFKHVISKDKEVLQ